MPPSGSNPSALSLLQKSQSIDEPTTRMYLRQDPPEGPSTKNGKEDTAENVRPNSSTIHPGGYQQSPRTFDVDSADSADVELLPTLAQYPEAIPSLEEKVDPMIHSFPIVDHSLDEVDRHPDTDYGDTDDEELATAIALSLQSPTTDETEPLPDDWDYEYFLDYAYDVRDRFRAIPKRREVGPELIFGSEKLLLEFKVDAAVAVQGDSPISWPSCKSSLWFDRAHRQRFFQRHCHCHPSKTPIRHYISLDNGDEIEGILLPWERAGPLDEYIAPAEGDRWSPARGIHFPKINLAESWEFRLLLLLPTFGQRDAPLRASIFVSQLYLHSCFVAVRHSRGNPAVRGAILIDGKEASITKALEVFLRHVRRRDRCVVLYIRELCINKFDAEEVSARFNGEFHSVVENSSCGILDMSRVMENLEDADLIAPRGSREKLWDELGKNTEIPWHNPRILSTLKWPQDNLTADQIAELPAYNYVPLDLVVQEIRLVTLHPATNKEDPIRVDIAHAPMYGDLNYGALSYVWGSNKLTSRIRASGNQMMITQNLEKALRQLRENHSPNRLTLWIDAICIDQQNEAEKSRHIPKMQKIYEAANGVLIWIAPDEDISTTAVDFLHEINQPKITIFKCDDDGRSTGELVETRRLAEAWAELYRFYSLPFFTRKWIIQEISSASVPTVVLSDTKLLAWRDVSTASFAMSRLIEQIVKLWVRQSNPIINQYQELTMIASGMFPFCDFGLDTARRIIEQVQTLTYIRQLRVKGQSPSFMLLALLSQHADCTDARDKLYSLWSISQESENLMWKPSYGASIEANYTGFAKAYALHHGRLDIICATQIPAAANVVPGTPFAPDLDLPSWCPDWRQTDTSSSLLRRLILYGDWQEKDVILDIDHARYHADCLERGVRAAKFSFTDRQLLAHGSILDTVKYISKTPHQAMPLVNIPSDWVLDSINHVRKTDGTEFSSAELASRFYCTMIGEPVGSVDANWQMTENGANVYRNDANSPLASITSYDARAANMIRGRRLIVTEKGYLGLAPWHVKEGFKLAIILGCSVPVLIEYIDEDRAEFLRGVGYGQEDQTFITAAFQNTKTGWYFRGDCFVQGWMEGEMLREYGNTTEEAWAKLSTDEHGIQIY